MRDIRQFWGIRRLAHERVGLVRFGQLRFWLARAEREWGLAEEPAEEGALVEVAQVPHEVVPRALDWTRTFFAEAPRDFQFRPLLADRPLILQTVDDLELPPRERIDLHVQIPLGLEVQVLVDDKPQVLGCMRHKRLSDTWFGSVKEGELCYNMPVRAVLSPDELSRAPDWALVRITLINHTREILKVGKICLRPKLLHLFGGAEGVYAGAVSIPFEGVGKGGTVHYSNDVSAYEANTIALVVGQKEEKGVAGLFGSVWRRTDTVAGR